MRAEDAAVVVLVEGGSDQVATLARRYGRDLAGEGVVVLPSGVVHGIVRYWRRFGPQGAGVRVVGLVSDHAAADRGDRTGAGATAAGRPGRGQLTAFPRLGE